MPTPPEFCETTLRTAKSREEFLEKYDKYKETCEKTEVNCKVVVLQATSSGFSATSKNANKIWASSAGILTDPERLLDLSPLSW